MSKLEYYERNTSCSIRCMDDPIVIEMRKNQIDAEKFQQVRRSNPPVRFRGEPRTAKDNPMGGRPRLAQ